MHQTCLGMVQEQHRMLQVTFVPDTAAWDLAPEAQPRNAAGQEQEHAGASQPQPQGSLLQPLSSHPVDRSDDSQPQPSPRAGGAPAHEPGLRRPHSAGSHGDRRHVNVQPVRPLCREVTHGQVERSSLQPPALPRHAHPGGIGGGGHSRPGAHAGPAARLSFVGQASGGVETANGTFIRQACTLPIFLHE